VQVCSGAFFSLVLTKHGAVYSAGANTHGQLGLGGFTDRNSWAQVTFEDLLPEDWIMSIAAGRHTTLAISFLGLVFSAGLQVGARDDRGRPLKSTTFRTIMEFEPDVSDMIEARKPELLQAMNMDPRGVSACLWAVGKRKEGRVVDVTVDGCIIEAKNDDGKYSKNSEKILTPWPHDIEAIDEVLDVWDSVLMQAKTEMGWDAAPPPNPNVMEQLEDFIADEEEAEAEEAEDTAVAFAATLEPAPAPTVAFAATLEPAPAPAVETVPA